jgi:hypothetical protein
MPRTQWIAIAAGKPWFPLLLGNLRHKSGDKDIDRREQGRWAV